MTLSLENRQRLALLIFFIGDHLLWYYGGHFQHVSLFYVVLSELIRVGAFLTAIMSFFNFIFVKPFLLVIMVYCLCMFPLNFHGAVNYSVVLKETSMNFLLFKKNATVAIDYAWAAMIIYIWFLLFLYLFVFRYMDRHLLEKK